MTKVPLPLRIDEDLLSRIDDARGDVPRTRFVVRALEAALATGLRQAVTPAQSEDPHARLSPSGSSAPPVVPAKKTPEAVSSPGSGASAQSRVMAPPSGAAPSVVSAELPPAGLGCPEDENHAIVRHSRMAGHPWACPLCNRKAVPR